MEKSSCELLSGSYPNYVSELENLRWTILVNLVFNNFLTYTTIMLNVVTIYAMRKTSVIVAKHSEDTAPESRCYRCWCWINCSTSLLLAPGQVVAKEYFRYAYVMLSSTFCLASFLGVVAVSVDRFLAIHLHLRYQELVTHKRVVAVVISIWFVSAIFSGVLLWLLPDRYSRILTFSGIVGLVLVYNIGLHQNLVIPQDATRIRFKPSKYKT